MSIQLWMHSNNLFATSISKCKKQEHREINKAYEKMHELNFVFQSINKIMLLQVASYGIYSKKIFSFTFTHCFGSMNTQQNEKNWRNFLEIYVSQILMTHRFFKITMHSLKSTRKMSLTKFCLMFLFYIFWKHQIIEGFLVFSGRIKWKISRSWVNSLDKQTDFKYFQRHLHKYLSKLRTRKYYKLVDFLFVITLNFENCHDQEIL